MPALVFTNRSGQNITEINAMSTCFLQEIPNCGQEKEECIKNATLKDKGCLIPCDGLYADIENFSLKQISLAGHGSNILFSSYLNSCYQVSKS